MRQEKLSALLADEYFAARAKNLKIGFMLLMWPPGNSSNYCLILGFTAEYSKSVRKFTAT
jgi:hypothetical protein